MRLGAADVNVLGSLIEVGVRPSVSAIDELIGDHELARLHLRLQAADSRRGDYAGDPDRMHRPEIGAVIDRGRRDRVLAPMSRHESDLAIADPADRYIVAWHPTPGFGR